MSMPSFLTSIALATEMRVKEMRAREPEATLRQRAEASRAPLDFLGQLRAIRGRRVIAEGKRKSPSQGDIALALDPVELARAFVVAGASALSVLTEPNYFGGSLADLRNIRLALPTTPLLMKDFVLDSYQVLLARAEGADAVLLIHALLGPARLRVLHGEALALGLTPLVEVHTESELTDSLALGAALIGVNNRDLHTLQVNIETSARLAPRGGAFFVSESGLRRRAELERLEALGFGAFLVGTSLVREKNPGSALRQLLGEGAEP